MLFLISQSFTFQRFPLLNSHTTTIHMRQKAISSAGRPKNRYFCPAGAKIWDPRHLYSNIPKMRGTRVPRGGGGGGWPEIVGLLKKNKSPTFFDGSRSDAKRTRKLLVIRSRQQYRRTKYAQNFPPPAAVYLIWETVVSLASPHWYKCSYNL